MDLRAAALEKYNADLTINSIALIACALLLLAAAGFIAYQLWRRHHNNYHDRTTNEMAIGLTMVVATIPAIVLVAALLQYTMLTMTPTYSIEQRMVEIQQRLELTIQNE